MKNLKDNQIELLIIGIIIVIVVGCTSTIIMVRKSDNANIDAQSADTISLHYHGTELKVDVNKAKKDALNE